MTSSGVHSWKPHMTVSVSVSITLNVSVSVRISECESV